TQSITVTASGSYTVTVTSVGNCSATSQPVAVTIKPVPQPTIIASGNTNLCQGNNVTLTASGSTLGNALKLNGTNTGYVDIVPGSSVNNLGVSGFTLETWINPASVNDVKSIIRKIGDYNLYILNGSLAAEVWPIGNGNTTWKKIEGISSVIPVNTWSHVAATWDGTTLK